MPRLIVILSLYFSIPLLASCQETEINKISYAGGFITVPENQTWVLDRVFINGGDVYNIMVNKDNFAASYAAGDTIKTPYYIPEMELLDSKDMVQYEFYFKPIKQ